MKKLIALILLVVGFVGQTKAWDSVYLFFKGNGYRGVVYPFDKIDDNNFYYIVPKNNTFCDNDDFYFRFNVKWYENNEEKWKEFGPSTNNQLISVDGFVQNPNSDINASNAYKIASNDISNYYRINLSYKEVTTGNWKWVISVTYSEPFNITYKDEGNWSWGNVYFYVYQGSFNTTGNDHPGIEVTPSDGLYSATVEGFIGGQVQFNDGGGNKHDHKELVNNGVYHSHGSDIDLYAIKANISPFGYATFSSTKALDFDSETTIEPCKASVNERGLITYTPVDYVAANEGVFLRRKDGTKTSASSVIPLHANQSVAANASNDFKAITSKTLLEQIADSKTNYILTNKKADGNIGPLGFYKVNTSGSWCAAGTAYLATSVTPAIARIYFPLEDETESVESIAAEQKSLDAPVYDLQGRCVTAPQKGLYIVNGKKIVINK